MKYEETIQTALPLLVEMDSIGLAFGKSAKLSFGWGSYDSGNKTYKVSLPTIWCMQERGCTLEDVFHGVARQYSIDFSKAAKVWMMTDRDGPLVQALIATQVNNYHAPGWTDILDEDIWTYFQREKVSITQPDRDIKESRFLSLRELITRLQVMSLKRSLTMGVSDNG